MASHSSIRAWKIPWTEEPGRLQSMGSLRVRYDWATSLSPFLSCIGEGNGNPLQCSCLENPRDWGAWWAAIYGVVQNRTQLKWLSSSSSKGLTWSDIKFLLLQFSLWIILLSSSGDIIHVLSFPYPQIPRSIFMGITAFAKVLKSC